MENTNDLPRNEKISPMISQPNFSPMGKAECEFCGNVREQLPGLGFFRWVLFEPCACEGANKDRADREVARLKEEQEEAENRKRYNVVRLFKEIPHHFRDRTFDAFKVTPENQDAYNLARAYPAEDGKQSILLMGPPGTGKTHLAAAVAINQVYQQKSVIFGTVPTILGRIKSTFSGEGATESEVKSAIMECSLLVLDDLGKEKPSEWVEETLYEIINARYVRKLPVIITTNVGLKAVEGRYPWNGEAIVSRLFEMCRGVQVGGADYRRRK